MTDAKIAYVIDDVSFHAGDVEILTGVSFEIAYGEVLCLVGPNGAGKSTLLSLLCADVSPSTGGIRLDDRPLGDWSARELARARAVLLQENRVDFAFTAADVVEMGRAPWPADDEKDAEIVRASMVRTDVVHLAQRAYPALSGGEKARVSLARALAQDAPVLMLDEPTAALDLRHQEDVLRLARELATAGRAVVVVLHDLSLAGAYADRIAMIDAGRLVALGPPVEVLTAERIEAVYGTAVRIIPDPDTGLPLVLPRRGPGGDLGS